MSRKSRFLTWRRAAMVAAVIGAVILHASDAGAQQFTLDLGDDSGSTTSAIIQLLMLTTALTLAPSFMLMVTSFSRLIVVFAMLRQAMGSGVTPPNQVLTALALFMTLFIMQPVFTKAWDAGIQPLLEEQIDEFEAFDRAMGPFHEFMLSQTRAKDLRLFMDMGGFEPVDNEADTPLRALIPAYMISELLRAFEIGFLIYLPFVIIDMVVASVLMSMGMMMLPPMMLALPFKLIFFVLVDGWHLVVGSLLQGYGIVP